MQQGHRYCHKRPEPHQREAPGKSLHPPKKGQRHDADPRQIINGKQAQRFQNERHPDYKHRGRNQSAHQHGHHNQMESAERFQQQVAGIAGLHFGRVHLDMGKTGQQLKITTNEACQRQQGQHRRGNFGHALPFPLDETKPCCQSHAVPQITRFVPGPDFPEHCAGGRLPRKSANVHKSDPSTFPLPRNLRDTVPGSAGVSPASFDFRLPTGRRDAGAPRKADIILAFIN